MKIITETSLHNDGNGKAATAIIAILHVVSQRLTLTEN